MIITELIEHIHQDDEVIYILKPIEDGKVVVFVACVINETFETMSKTYDSRDQAIKSIKEIEISHRVKFDSTIN